MAVNNLFNRLKFWKRTINQDPLDSQLTPEHRLTITLKRYEIYLSHLQSIVMWDNPAVSVLCILFVNILFWIFVSLEWRFYGIISSVLLALSIHDAWTGHVWPEISVEGTPPPSPDMTDPTPAHPSVVAVSKLVTSSCTVVRRCVSWMRNLRLQQPGLFCCLCSLLCSCLLLLGRSVSGLALVYLLLMSALLGPALVVKFLPPQMKQTVAQYAACVQQAFAKYSTNDASDDEYLPITTSEDIALLTRASDMHHDTYDSVTNPDTSSDIVSGLAVMPSHEEDSLGNLSDLEPGASLLPLDTVDDSDSNPDDHQIQAVTSNVLSSVSLLANVMRPQPTITREADSDSDNDDYI
ncbi:reticulophagy regulator 3 isoform X5 [Homalodisca vitripennis]|nr:reticulophagy regulator 3 isoform X4 [Homalodisca vitripennis]XP_046678759.1 reticulophagy regulator 3 isoform X5 [Homalodisca vitripennis]